MKRTFGLGGSCLLVALVASACSGSSTGTGTPDGGTSGSGGGLGAFLGSGGGKDGGTGSGCTAAATDTTCDTCIKQSCCSQVTACQADPACVTAAQTCTTASCFQANANANALLACAQPPCATACSSSSTTPTGGGRGGDPCSASAPCNAGLSCNGAWCAPATCQTNADCGVSSAGVQAICEVSGTVAGQTQCFPGCPPAGCTIYGANASCIVADDGQSICAGAGSHP